MRKIYSATTFIELRCCPNHLRDLLGLHDCFVCRNGPYALLQCAGWVCKSISVCSFNPKKQGGHMDTGGAHPVMEIYNPGSEISLDRKLTAEPL